MRSGKLAVLFLGLSFLYHSNLRPIASGDSLAASILPFSILLDGSVSLDRFAPYIGEHVWYSSQILYKSTHWYSVYPIAGPVLATPLYLPLAFVPWVARQSPGTLIALARVLEKVVAVMLAAGSAVALLCLLRRLASERAAWILTLVFALGTGNWSTSSQALWQHTYGQLPIIGCLYAIERWRSPDVKARWYWIAGALAACALAIRPTNLALLPALAIALWWKPRRIVNAVRVFLPAAVALAITGAYNFEAFHRIAGGYPIQLDTRLIDGLLGILLSPGRGLLVYTPVVLFALAAFAPRARASRLQHQPLVLAATMFVLLQIVFVAMWHFWWGGYCWGPRLLTETLSPLMVLIAVGLPAIHGSGMRWTFAGATAYCCLIQALGVYCYPKGHWDHLPVSVNNAPARLWDWGDSPITRTARGGVAWEPYAIVAATVTGGRTAGANKLRELGINSY